MQRQQEDSLEIEAEIHPNCMDDWKDSLFVVDGTYEYDFESLVGSEKRDSKPFAYLLTREPAGWISRLVPTVRVL